MTLDLSKSQVRYRRADGTFSTSKADRLFIDKDALFQIAQGASHAIPPGWFLAIASRESGYVLGSGYVTNEYDTDFNTDGTVRKQSGGLYQLDTGVLKDHGIIATDAQLADPAQVTIWFARVMEANLQQIAGQAEAAYDKPGNIQFPWDQPPPDALYYLALSHNLGLGSVLTSISKYGMNAQQYAQRNPGMTRQLAYADAARSGAAQDAPPSALANAAEALTKDENGETDAGKIILLGAAVVAVVWALSELT